MEEKQKPKEIVELEEVYGIELKEQIDDNVLIERNHYRLNKNGNVIDISLVKNKIEEIKGFDNFKHLEILDLSMNEITKIENLDNLKNLEILFLGFNNIKKIGNLSNLKNLKVLLLPFNQIENIEEIKQLVEKIHFPKLKNLQIYDNPF